MINPSQVNTRISRIMVMPWEVTINYTSFELPEKKENGRVLPGDLWETLRQAPRRLSFCSHAPAASAMAGLA